MSRHIFDDRHDTDSRRYCAVYLAGSRLVVEMHDLGAVVQQAFGADEYEAIRTLSAEETVRLRDLLGAPHDLIAEIGARFDSDAAGFGRFLREHGLEGDFWNRIGS